MKNLNKMEDYMKNYLDLKARMIEKVLRDCMEEIRYPKILEDGMRYALLNGGKRIRPILLLMTLELFDTDQNLGLPSAAAIEFIHTYSLVHDDLPSLDNDDYRRGKLTTHKKYGEAEALLIGDALLTEAFHILASKNKDIPAEKIVKIIEKTAMAAGANGMIGGQLIDTESEGEILDMPSIQYIHTHKTGMMLRLPIELALIIADVDKEDTENMIKYADLIGIAFQIKDDILDVEGNFDKLGKQVGSDVQRNKATYPALFGIEKSKEILNEKIAEAKDIIERRYGKEKGDKFIQLAEYIGVREK